uniref:Capsid protein n=1 Tax=Giant panda Picornavirales TaxID=2903094 RepID=A0A8K1ZLQ2_9VIRU|nr:MAG: hypothetical protein 2 [Giant panda Picornavirales]
MMDAPISKEVHETTSFINDGPVKIQNEDKPERIDQYDHKFTDLADWLARPKIVKQGTWNTSSTDGTPLIGAKKITDFLGLPGSTWQAKMAGFNLVRATAHLTLQANANPFQQGALIYSYIPQFFERTGSLSTNLFLLQKTQQHHVVYNCRDSEVELVIPYVSPSHYYDRARGEFDWGALTLTVLSALKTEPSAGSLSVDYTIWCHWTDVEFAAPAVATMDKESEAASARPISKALKSAGKIAGKLGDVPGLATYLKPLSWSLDTASRLAYTLGYAKPLQNDRINMFVKQANRYSGVSDGPDSALEVGLSANNSVAIKKIASIRPSVDEMSIEFLKKRECLVGSFNINTLTTGLLPTTYPHNPINYYVQGNETYGAHSLSYRCYPPIGHISFLFSQWRGSIKLRFKAIKTQLVTARLSGQYNVSTLSTLNVEEVDFTAPRYIWDLAVSDEIIVDLPWLIGTNYLGLSDLAGTFTWSVTNRLKANASCADNIDILCFISFGDDFELQAPVTSAPANPPFYYAAMDVVDENPMGAQRVQPALTKYAEIGVGEFFTSIKQLLMRYNILNTTVTNPNPIACNPYFFAATSANVTTGVQIYPQYGGDILSYIGLMYGAFRGSIKVGITNVTTETAYDVSLTSLPATNTNIAVARSPFTANTWQLPGVGRTLNTGRTTVTDHSVYVRVPYYTDTLFTMVVPNVGNQPINTYGDCPQVWAECFSSGSNSMLTRAVCDDFILSNFVCTPLVLVAYS